jgi:hypothetical protein
VRHGGNVPLGAWPGANFQRERGELFVCGMDRVPSLTKQEGLRNELTDQGRRELPARWALFIDTGCLFGASSGVVNVADRIVKKGWQETIHLPVGFCAEKMTGKHDQLIFGIVCGFDTISRLKDETGSRPQNMIRSAAGQRSPARQNDPKIEVAKGRRLPAPGRFAAIQARLADLDR